MNFTKRGFSLLLCMLIISSCFLTSYCEQNVVNVALNKKITASGFSYNMSPQALVDGNMITGWSSENNDNTWAVIDLGKKTKIHQIEIVTRQDVDQSWTRNNFRVECSNSAEFNTSKIVGEVGDTPLEYKGIYTCVVDESFRYVRYKKSKGNYSFLSEIKVLSYKTDVTDETTDIPAELKTKTKLLDAICVDTTILKSNVVTRGDATKIFAQMLKINRTNEDYYTDIKDNETRICANSLYKAGILDIGTDKKLSPYQEITYNEVIKIAVCALGYKTKAEHKGGYPYGYNSCANEIGITRNIPTGKFTTKEFIFLLCNMLDTNIYEITTISDKDITFEKSDVTFIKRYHNIEKVKGVVNENFAFSMITSSSSLAKNNILINGEVYIIDTEEYIDLFAQKVICYYKKDNSDIKNVIYMYPEDKQNIKSVKNKNFKNISGNRFYYVDDVKNSTNDISLDSKCLFMKNGELCSKSAIENLKHEGLITLYDNNYDNNYDFVRVIETKTNIVQKVQLSDNNITIHFKDKSFVTTQNSKLSYVKCRNGDFADPSDFKKNDIVSIVDNPNTFEAYVGMQSVEGAVTSIDDKEITINFSSTYEIAQKPINIDATKVNNYGFLYFDYYGNAFYFDNSISDGKKYGYLVGIDKVDLSGETNLKILTQSGSFAIYKIYAPVRIDGINYTHDDEINKKLIQLFASYSDGVGMMIQYSSNQSMKINLFDTELDNTVEDDTSLHNVVEMTSGNYYTAGVLAQEYIVDEDVVIFAIPKDASDDRKFEVHGKDFFKDAGQYRVRGYGEKGNKSIATLKAVVVPTVKPEFDEEPQMLLVDRVAEVFEKDEIVPCIYGYSNGNYLKFTLNESFYDKVEYLSCGDVLKIAVTNNRIDNMVYVLNCESDYDLGGLNENDTPYWNGYGGGYSVYNEPLCGYVGVYNEKDKYINVRAMNDCNLSPTPLKQSFTFDSTRARLYICDLKNGKITIGNSNDITSYQSNSADFSKIYFRTYRGRPREIVIYKNN